MTSKRKITLNQLFFLMLAYVFGGLCCYGIKSATGALLCALFAFSGTLPAAICRHHFPGGAVFRALLAALCAYPLIRDFAFASAFCTSVYRFATPGAAFAVLLIASVILAPRINVSGRTAELMVLPAVICIAVCFFGKWNPHPTFYVGAYSLSPCGALAVPLVLSYVTVTEEIEMSPALSSRTDKKSSPGARLLISALGAFLGGFLYLAVSSFEFEYGNIAEYFLSCFAALLRLSASVFAVIKLCDCRGGRYIAAVFALSSLISAYAAALPSYQKPLCLVLTGNLVALIFAVCAAFKHKDVTSAG